jgi:predicted 3-demethylubiquinone-9 3-methyltransferase (glyoxalase superfamily)
MPKPLLPKIVPHLWYTNEAEEAARFYATVFPDSHVDPVTSLPTDSAIGLPAQSSLSTSHCSARHSWR